MSLVVRSLRVSVDGRVLLDGVDLDVATGTVVSLMGANGTGKSTLLRAVAGLHPIDDGTVLVDGSDVTRRPTHRRGIGMMFQDLALFPHLDVGANVAYGLRMHGVARRERDRRVAELLELVRLPGFDRRDVGTLSGGERQRVALARALAPRPHVLLLDEPFAAVDAALRSVLVADVSEVLRSLGLTALHVTHDEDEPRALGAVQTIRLGAA